MKKIHLAICCSVILSTLSFGAMSKEKVSDKMMQKGKMESNKMMSDTDKMMQKGKMESDKMMSDADKMMK